MEKIKLENGSFTLGGKTWYVSDDISVNRLPELEKQLAHFINGVDIDKQQVILTEIYNDMNSMKFVDGGHKLVNLLNATNLKKAGMHHPKLLIATMYINEHKEDTSKWSLDIANEKIKAWGDGNVSFFFELVDTLLVGILSGIYGISGSYLEKLLQIGEARSPQVATGKTQQVGIKLKTK